MENTYINVSTGHVNIPWKKLPAKKNGDFWLVVYLWVESKASLEVVAINERSPFLSCCCFIFSLVSAKTTVYKSQFCFVWWRKTAQPAGQCIVATWKRRTCLHVAPACFIPRVFLTLPKETWSLVIYLFFSFPFLKFRLLFFYLLLICGPIPG